MIYVHLNASEMPRCCANAEALNEHSETGCETEQVGSGVKVQRQSGVCFLNAIGNRRPIHKEGWAI